MKKMKYSEEDIERNPLLAYINEEIEVDDAELDKKVDTIIFDDSQFINTKFDNTIYPATITRVSANGEDVITAISSTDISSNITSWQTQSPTKVLVIQPKCAITRFNDEDKHDVVVEDIRQQIIMAIAEEIVHGIDLKLDSYTDPASFTRTLRVKSPELSIRFNSQ